jgi:hypothetical protein
VYLVTKWRDKNLPTISRHAASSRRASLLFAVVLIGCGILFYAWLMAWFVPHLQLGLPFQVVLTLAVACQVVTALAPDTEGLSRKVHRYAAYTMAVLYLPLIAFMITDTHLSGVARIVGSLLGLYMLATFIIVVMLGKAKSRYLLFQALYIMMFQSAILVAAYA